MLPQGWAPGQPLDGFGPRELANATAIVQAGAEMRMPRQAQVIAVATAIQESRLLVLGNPAVPGSMHPPPQGVGRDHDSVGLFGQRGTGWGPLAVRMDPRGSARLFYQRLRGIPHWQRLPLTQAADAVQHSALPTAYEQWEPVARRIVGAVNGVSCGPGAGRRRRTRRVTGRPRSPPGRSPRSAPRTCGAAATRRARPPARPGCARRRAAGSTARG